MMEAQLERIVVVVAVLAAVAGAALYNARLDMGQETVSQDLDKREQRAEPALVGTTAAAGKKAGQYLLDRHCWRRQTG